VERFDFDEPRESMERRKPSAWQNSFFRLCDHGVESWPCEKVNLRANVKLRAQFAAGSFLRYQEMRKSLRLPRSDPSAIFEGIDQGSTLNLILEAKVFAVRKTLKMSTVSRHPRCQPQILERLVSQY